MERWSSLGEEMVPTLHGKTCQLLDALEMLLAIFETTWACHSWIEKQVRRPSGYAHAKDASRTSD